MYVVLILRFLQFLSYLRVIWDEAVPLTSAKVNNTCMNRPTWNP